MLFRSHFLCTITAFSVWLAVTPARALGPDQLPNGSFEYASDSQTPDGWNRQVHQPGASLTWEFDATHDGSHSVRITNPTPNDSAWMQSLTLEPNRNYLLSGWIKTEDVAHTTESVDAGAHLSTCTSWQRTAALTGTNDWTYVRMAFNSGSNGIVSICARIGYWSGVASGTAWFDSLRVTEIFATDPHPRWKILVLIYEHTDVTYTDATGTHHVVGQIEPTQLATAAANATRFVETDIPALSSGNMVPELTIRYPGTLRQLTQYNGWWPSPADTAAERDPAFDSVIVIWQPTVTDQTNGQQLWIGNAAGLAAPMVTDQTYAAIIIEAATLYGHLNVFKHEWGHSLLFFYDAAGTAPKPAVTNHAQATQYVHCGTGESYVWLDETDANPIPNSIYSNSSGFTHDYYSGTTAVAADPLRCLGVTPAAWAAGGPVSIPGELRAPSPGEQIHAIRTTLQQLVETGILRRSWSQPLEAHLDHAASALGAGDTVAAVKSLTQFVSKVRSLESKGRLPTTAADLLVTNANGVLQQLAMQ